MPSRQDPAGARPLGWGILGTGAMARDFAEGLRYVDGAVLAAVGSRTSQKAERFARLFGAAPHGSYRELVADPRVDVVYVATPANEHKSNSLLALEAGKAVLCEKPFAMNAAEAQEIVDCARQRKLFCMEAMWMHFIPGMQKAMELIHAGAIGEPRMLSADFGYPAAYDPKARLFDAALGGGAMLDRGVYCLALAWRLFGKPDRLTAVSTLAPSGVDEQSSVIARYSAGQIAALSATLSGYSTNEAVIVGTKGRITIHEPFCRPERLTVAGAPAAASGEPVPIGRSLRDRLRSSGLVRRLRRLLPGRARTLHVSHRGNGFNYEAAEVVRCIANGELESPVWPLDQTVGVMQMLDLVRSRSST